MGIARKNRKATIYRPQRQPDGQGGHVSDLAKVDTVLAGYSRENASESDIADRERSQIEYTVYTSRHADIQKNDFIVIDEISLEVLSTKKPSQGDLEVKTEQKQPPTEEIV